MKDEKFVSEVLGKDALLTPSDLYSKQFRKAWFGGCDRRDVDAFLERVADLLESLTDQVRELKAQQEEYKGKLEEYRQMEATLRSALLTSQKFGEDLVESARREADNLLESARVEKERLLAQATKLPVALSLEINQLQQQRDRLRQDLLGILATHKTLLESLSTAEETVGVAGPGSPDGTVIFDTEREDAGPNEAAEPIESEDVSFARLPEQSPEDEKESV